MDHDDSVTAALNDIKKAIQTTKVIQQKQVKSETRIPIAPTETASNDNDDPWSVRQPLNHDIDEEDEDDDEDEDDEEEDDEEDDDEEDSEDLVEERVPTPKNVPGEDDLDTDQETDRLLGQQYNDDNGYFEPKVGNRTDCTD